MSNHPQSKYFRKGITDTERATIQNLTDIMNRFMKYYNQIQEMKKSKAKKDLINIEGVV